MVILLTGATGFLGSYLLDDLSEFDIRVITRSPEKLENSTLDVVKADISKKLPTGIFDDVTTLIHSAAKVGSWPKDPQAGYYQTNVEGTQSIINQAIEKDVDKIIYTSSYFALGATGEEIRDEGWINPPDFQHPYITTKFQAGQIVDRIHEKHPILQLLPTVIIGKGIENSISRNLIDYINGKLPGLPGGGSSVINVVSADDVARSHLLGVNNEVTGKFLIGGENISYYEFFEKFGNRLNINPPRSIPIWLGRLYAFFQEFRNEPKLTREEITAFSNNYAFQSEKEDELGYEPSPIDPVIDEMIVGFLHSGRLNSKGERRVLDYLNSKE